MKGSADQQNIYEKALEDVSHRLANALHEYYLDNARADEAAEWDMTISDWRRMREQALLGKARRLLEQMRTVGAGEGKPYGMSAEAQTELDDMISDYAEAIGQPTKRRTDRKRDTATLRPAWRGVREIFESMDRLVVQFPKLSPKAGSPRGGSTIAARAANRQKRRRPRRRFHGSCPERAPGIPSLWVVTPGGLSAEKFPFGESVRLIG